MKKLSIIAIVISSLAIIGQIFIFATTKSDPDDTYRKAMQADYRVYCPVLPDSLTFCGEAVPLDSYYVREGLDRELIVNMYWQSNMLLWMKRAGRYFPVIEPILKKNGMPEDLKYLCVIESGLQPVGSPAGAQGYWQFIKSTGQTYNLEITDEIDMRNHIELSTEAACRMLKKMYKRFGSWSLATATYNLGENGVAQRCANQDIHNYWDLKVPNETTRYVYRILAIKMIMQQPQAYGYMIRHSDLYPPIPTRQVTLTGQNVDLHAFAKANGSTYKMLRELNPWIQTGKLKNKDNKTYTVQLPAKTTSWKEICRKREDKRLVDRL